MPQVSITQGIQGSREGVPMLFKRSIFLLAS
jgi:hypothetical protein